MGADQHVGWDKNAERAPAHQHLESLTYAILNGATTNEGY
jgi:hypothetical protein